MATADQALLALQESAIDVAILDIQLAAETSERVARAMLARDIRFVFLTGFADLGVLPEDLRRYRVLQKPLDAEEVRSILCETVT